MSVLRVIPLPRKFFSVRPPPITDPDVPKPAPKEISPVGFSSTAIFTILVLSLVPFTTFDSTFLKIPNDLI